MLRDFVLLRFVYAQTLGDDPQTSFSSPMVRQKRALEGSERAKTVEKLKNRKIKKPYIKVVRDECLWDSGRWEWWEISLELIPPYYRDIWPYKTSETLIFLLFSQYWGRSKKSQ